MTAERATDILTAYFKKQCGLGLSYVKVDDFLPHQNHYMIISEHKCIYEPEVRRHRIMLAEDGTIAAVSRIHDK